MSATLPPLERFEGVRPKGFLFSRDAIQNDLGLLAYREDITELYVRVRSGKTGKVVRMVRVG